MHILYSPLRSHSELVQFAVYKCEAPGALFGASMGYAGPIEAVLTLILLKIFMCSGFVTKTGGVALDENTKAEMQKMIDAGTTSVSTSV